MTDKIKTLADLPKATVDNMKSKMQSAGAGKFIPDSELTPEELKRVNAIRKKMKNKN